MPIAETLPRALGDTPPLEEIVRALAVCARTLAELHEEGIFHRDLKPSNLFMLDGRPLVLPGLSLAPGCKHAMVQGSGSDACSFAGGTRV